MSPIIPDLRVLDWIERARLGVPFDTCVMLACLWMRRQEKVRGRLYG